jgi:DNA helicase IV
LSHADPLFPQAINVEYDSMFMSKSEIAAEQRHVNHAYARLRAMEDRAKEVAAAAALQRASAGPLRDAIVRTGLQRAADLNIGDEPLVFGRLDHTDGHTSHIGRVAVYDDEHDPLVVDWRAPLAEPFYRATPGDPQGVVRRRHIFCRGQEVLNLEDELFDTNGGREDLVLVGEAALLDALGRSRTGRMRDIVATIQREQDEIIRAPLEGVLVVQGGPGTGKTAVGLHRAAYLLYKHRDRFRHTGVLVVGPNGLFLRYIEQVLPALGESATMTTAAELVPGITAIATDPLDVARIKGDVRMANVIKRAVADLEVGASEDVELRYEGRKLFFRARASKHMAKLARRRLRGRHNDKRRDLRAVLADYLFKQWRKKERDWVDLVGKEQRRAFIETLATDDNFRTALDAMWPAITAPQLVHRLFTDERALARASEGILSPDEQSLLHSDRENFSEADVALIDEVAPLLGPVRRKRRRRAAVDEEEQFGIDRLLDDLAEANPLVRSQRAMLAERLMGQRMELDDDEPEARVRERYGHIVVDEAQSLSPMQWRMIARRSRSRSITVLGDIGQAGGAWAPTDWNEVIDILRAETATVAELTLNYRTPAEIAHLADAVLAAAAPALRPPRSVREAGESPAFREVARASLETEALRIARDESSRLPEGRVALLSTPAITDVMRTALGTKDRDPRTMLDQPIAALTVDEARGLEFDVVVVVEPAAIVRECAGGLRALYVALTRPTQRLWVVSADALPEPLSQRGRSQ